MCRCISHLRRLTPPRRLTSQVGRMPAGQLAAQFHRSRTLNIHATGCMNLAYCRDLRERQKRAASHGMGQRSPIASTWDPFSRPSSLRRSPLVGPRRGAWTRKERSGAAARPQGPPPIVLAGRERSSVARLGLPVGSDAHPPALSGARSRRPDVKADPDPGQRGAPLRCARSTRPRQAGNLPKPSA